MTAAASAKTPLGLDTFFNLRRVSEAQISPDGKWIVYRVVVADTQHNTTSSTLWLVSTAGGPARQLTTTDKHDGHPRWSPDSRRILFASDRGDSEQLWLIDIDGGEARQLTKLSTGAHAGIWSPDGAQIAFVSAVYPEYSNRPFRESDAANKERGENREKAPVKAKVFTRLFYRHWDSWVDHKRQHLFVMPADGGDPRDVTPGDYDATPTSSTFGGAEDFTFDPSGKYLLFTAPPRNDEAWSTNYDIWRVAIAGGEPENLTAANPAADGMPRFSPDGRRLAWRRQSRPGFEADKWELVVGRADATGARSLTAHLDVSIHDFVWSADGNSLYYLAERATHMPLFQIALDGGQSREIADRGSFDSLTISSNGKLACTLATLRQPPEVVLIESSGKVQNVSAANAAALEALDLPTPESVQVPLADGQRMQMWIVKPPDFDASRKWPLVYLVHGGPQGAWEDAWSWRWNPELWAAQGYVVALPNPRGSSGFGQRFLDEISGDWSGKCFDDLMAGVAYLEQLPYVDPARMAAAGASFGGYMMNWFAGHTDKFKTLIVHCGVYNFDSMYATTDELWFDEWEHGGTPWENPKAYEKHSPHRHAKAFKTPMLIIHNDLDFRVPVSEGFQLFTTLQRLRIPSKMINFPDEGHWVLKPANSRFWHEQVFDWLKQYVEPRAK